MKKVKLYEQYLAEAEDEKRIKRIAKSTSKFLRALSRGHVDKLVDLIVSVRTF